ncbi:MAG: hypothetical protein IMF11_15950 [Proteobacteria bacterium]|nr:hypothetical protein [Pseudomonadota bacterium]
MSPLYLMIGCVALISTGALFTFLLPDVLTDVWIVGGAVLGWMALASKEGKK